MSNSDKDDGSQLGDANAAASDPKQNKKGKNDDKEKEISK